MCLENEDMGGIGGKSSKFNVVLGGITSVK